MSKAEERVGYILAALAVAETVAGEGPEAAIAERVRGLFPEPLGREEAGGMLAAQTYLAAHLLSAVAEYEKVSPAEVADDIRAGLLAGVNGGPRP